MDLNGSNQAQAASRFMFAVLANRTYLHLFLAQVLALFGTGLMTVALALLAFDLAGADAGAVLGTALAIKMVAYVSIAPVAAGFTARFRRRDLLVFLDLVRVAIALALPFVDAVWQIYVLIGLLQSASAAFTPTFQATIPDILPDEEDYTKALSLSRMAYDLENLLSPMVAAVLIGLIGFHWLFSGTVFGFLLSAALIRTANLRDLPPAPARETPLRRVTKGSFIFLSTPRLRGLLALNLTVAAAGAMVIVNSVVLIKSVLGRSDTDLALTMAAFGAGSMTAAVLLPRLLKSLKDRSLMIAAASLLPLLLFGAIIALDVLPAGTLWSVILLIWLWLGACTSAVLVPTGRLLRKSSHPTDRPLLFAAQFALSHACWLITYPLAGWLGSVSSMMTTLICLGSIAAVSALSARWLWPADDQDVVAHEHPELPPDHPHLRDVEAGKPHVHSYIIDDLHSSWPATRR